MTEYARTMRVAAFPATKWCRNRRWIIAGRAICDTPNLVIIRFCRGRVRPRTPPPAWLTGGEGEPRSASPRQPGPLGVASLHHCRWLQVRRQKARCHGRSSGVGPLCYPPWGLAREAAIWDRGVLNDPNMAPSKSLATSTRTRKRKRGAGVSGRFPRWRARFVLRFFGTGHSLARFGEIQAPRPPLGSRLEGRGEFHALCNPVW